jgi:hypothetical protein
MASKVAILGKEVPLVIPLSYGTQAWKLLYKEVQNQRLAACSEKDTGSGLRVIDNLNGAVRNLKPGGSGAASCLIYIFSDLDRSNVIILF